MLKKHPNILELGEKKQDSSILPELGARAWRRGHCCSFDRDEVNALGCRLLDQLKIACGIKTDHAWPNAHHMAFPLDIFHEKCDGSASLIQEGVHVQGCSITQLFFQKENIYNCKK